MIITCNIRPCAVTKLHNDTQLQRNNHKRDYTCPCSGMLSECNTVSSIHKLYPQLDNNG